MKSNGTHILWTTIPLLLQTIKALILYLIECKDGKREDRDRHHRDSSEKRFPAADAVDDRKTDAGRQDLHEAEADRGQRRTELVAKSDLNLTNCD